MNKWNSPATIVDVIPTAQNRDVKVLFLVILSSYASHVWSQPRWTSPRRASCSFGHVEWYCY